MIATHRHADGGLYRLVATDIAGKGEGEAAEWAKGVLYQCVVTSKMFWTTNVRFEDRFEQLPDVERVLAEAVEVIDPSADTSQELVASYTFRVEHAGDLRHMLITAAPMPNARNSVSKQFTEWMKHVLDAQAEAATRGLHIRDHEFPDLLGDVAAFHAKFGQEYNGKARLLPQDLHDFRVKFHDEETTEYRDEYPKLLDAIERKDRRDIVNTLELQLDALCDAVWVVLGTADLQFPRQTFFEAWKRVVKANMAKVLATDDPNAQDSGREVKYDIRKPAGWQAPDHRDLLTDNAIFDEVFGLPAPEAAPTEDATRYSDTRAI